MKAENILKTDVLDIIFQNKNKDYGAYELRKFYPNRLKKSIGITVLLVLIFAGLQSWKTATTIPPILVGPDVILDPYKPPIEKPKEIEKTKPAAKKIMEAVIVTTPIIVKQPIIQIPENAAIDTSFIGKTAAKGSASTSVVGEIPGDTKVKGGDDGKGKDDDGKKNDSVDDDPIFNPSEMPQFPGGSDALRNFMMRNLHQPDDIDEGQKIIIIAKFVVDKNGNISNVEITQNGREDLDNEVIRVINKMPDWKPGLQNGLPVAVYFRMPITFVNNN